MGLSLKRITGSQGLNLGSAVRGITENPLLAGLAGLALAPMTAGTSLAFLGASPLAAAATIGGIGALAGGSLEKGLQAGLSAYGGASIGQGLSAVGAPGAQNAMLANAPMDLTNEQLVSQLAKPSASASLAEGLTATARDPVATLKAIGSGSALKGAALTAAPLLASGLGASTGITGVAPQAPGMIRPYEFTRTPLAPQPGQQPSPRFGSPMVGAEYNPNEDTSERLWFDQYWTPATPYEAPGPEYSRAAEGGVMGETGYNLGGYSDGGRLLRGPGDGVSDSIPATIGAKKQPARLADGEFVVPARVVSELGNGSTDAGARKLYDMMDRIQASRKKSVGKGKVAVNSRADKYLPA